MMNWNCSYLNSDVQKRSFQNRLDGSWKSDDKYWHVDYVLVYQSILWIIQAFGGFIIESWYNVKGRKHFYLKRKAGVLQEKVEKRAWVHNYFMYSSMDIIVINSK